MICNQTWEFLNIPGNLKTLPCTKRHIKEGIQNDHIIDTISWWLQIAILLFMINRWTIKLWINNLTIQILSLNYNNTYTVLSKYWNIFLPSFSLFNQNQNFKDNSNSIKPNTYIHMNVKNSKNENNNLQKLLPNTVTIYFYFYFSNCAFFILFPFMFHQTFSNWQKYLSYMLTLNPIRKLYIPFVLKALQEPKSMQEIV